MNIVLRSAMLAFGILLWSPGLCQDSSIQFRYDKKRVHDDEAQVVIRAIISPGVKLYSIQTHIGDEAVSALSFDSSLHVRISGATAERGKAIKEKDPLLDATVVYYRDSLQWVQNLRVSKDDSLLVKGKIRVFYKKGDEYSTAEESFKVYFQKHASLASDVQQKNSSLWWVFLAAFGGGILALLTPCVYSMIPVTVSYFTKRSQTRSEGIRNAVTYALSIVLIFTLLGFLITLVFGPAALNNLATNWMANLLFFVLFLVFGFSFLGAFEINLPSSWTNRSGAKAGSGFAGIFFMALTLVLVSFSCTGPIIGNLLVLASRGSYLGPLVGMLGFSLALALPFALFAFFPSKLNILGKAGGWLNSVKVTLGFLELALALKFLSNADLARGWRLLDRELFISMWIVIFLLLGIYLLGKIRFHHDDELPKNDFGLPYLTVTRLMVAMASLVFAIYMIPGLWGAPLKGISAFVPPMGTQDFIMKAGPASATPDHPVSGELPAPRRYAEQMKAYEPEVVTSLGLTTYFDYDEALEVARKEKKPLMLDFTGINCVNCRKMEGGVWSDPGVLKKLKESFVIVSLYVDVQHIDLQENEIFYSDALQKQVTTVGDKNAHIQVTKYGANSQPYYFFLDSSEQRLVPEGYGYDPDIRKFSALLDTALVRYRLR